ncbi:3-deoxy-7-phosphoheptulonate synthase [Neiella marina]|uniref:3-deoxy-7-phosphoheptulonate synthase n=1 Tax=Neiella marina TaxID=508461 RepID=UPI000B3CD7F5|nr:3-deoxy-7-phosphoheptulonate synthase [Neiella marina]
MLKDTINDIHIQSEHVMITPSQLKAQYPVSETVLDAVKASRATIADIIHHRDPRLLVICGPCSIHDEAAALEYAKRLRDLQVAYQDSLYIVMRVYFEKPRTTVGWKGYINDPHMDGSFDVELGLKRARKLLIQIAELGLPMATEALDPISPQYLSELFAWSAIGARTTESQTHREMASGLSMPVGFKNGTDGSLTTAINALQSASSGHSFLGINTMGQVAVINTEGNPDGHVILRGGSKGPNYDAQAVAECEAALEKVGLTPSLMIDCSHGNSNKDYSRQPLVSDDVFGQITAGNRSIIGIMLESHINEGNQSSEQPFADMAYGVSITDACINWKTTASVLEKANQVMAAAIPGRQLA